MSCSRWGINMQVKKTDHIKLNILIYWVVDGANDSDSLDGLGYGQSAAPSHRFKLNMKVEWVDLSIGVTMVGTWPYQWLSQLI